jgi:hypothetical protein
MTPPILPTPSLGNFAQDISGAAAGFVKGLQAEKERRRQAALEQALLNVRAMQATKPDASNVRIITKATPQGLKFARVNVLTGEELPIADIDAPLQQFISTGETPEGRLTQLGTPRVALPGGPSRATEVELPPGQQPRDVRPSPFAVETPTGPQVMAIDPRRRTAEPIIGPSGAPIIPRAQEGEVVRAQAGVAMQLANGTMDEIEQRMIRGDPRARQAIDEVVHRLALQRATFRIPVVGEGLAGSIQTAEQLGLSEEGARYLAAFAAFISNAIPAKAGKQMTINEMLLIMREFVPGLGELDKPQALAQKIRNRKILVNTTMEAAGAGAERFRDLETPEPSALPTTPINPRFDPRQQRP